ncbi:MAG: GNAT family N-acetyltransferase [Prolixibacteraceae bacterium]|nr:GNAT family N-acetyltransferase [Prolixibacteraceae bacterium]
MAIKGNYIVRNMTADEVDNVAIEWAAREGWNPGLHDAPVFYATDPEGFFIGLLEGEPVACISAVAYNNEFGFIGLYIVKPGYRKEGFSIRLYNAVMEYMNGRNRGLDGVVTQQENYAKLGYKIAHNNIRCVGKTFKAGETFHDVVSIADIDFDNLVAFDASFFPVRRPQFLEKWLVQPGIRAFAKLTGGNIAGYGVIRECRQGYKIGPLFAKTPEIARELLVTLVGSVKAGELFYLDIPEVNKAAKMLTEEFRMRKVFETARMYSGPFPDINLDNVFGITTFELG